MDEIIDEIISDLASGLIDAPDSEIEAKLDEYDLDPSDRAAILEAIAQVRDAESMADDNLDPLNIDSVDAMADNDAAQKMADEDNSEVTVTEADTDGDGDTDYMSMEKDTPDNDKLTIEDLRGDNQDEGNADESDDKPHDEVVSDKKEKNIKKDSSTVCSDERMKNIISTLSNFRY